MKFFTLSGYYRLFILLLLGLFIAPRLVAQCGLSSFPEPGLQLNSGLAWQNVNVGSGTYAEFTAVPNTIYQFRYSNTGLSGYEWDMTISNSSSIIPYNNDFTPTRDPWTGGSCPPISRPQSSDFYSTFAGTVRVNTKAWNGACNDWVSGLGSAVLQYRAATAANDPGPGQNVWHVEAFATTNINIPQPNARYGHYVDNNLNFNSTTLWTATSSPTSASTWVGNGITPNDQFVLRARRTGFPCGVYRLLLQNADDDVQVYRNGSLLYSAACCVGTPTVIGDPSGYVLNAGDLLEVRISALCVSDNVFLELQPVSPTAVDGGVIGGYADSTFLCDGTVVGLFTNVVPGSGGVSGFTNGGGISYDWEVSINDSSFTSINISTPSWNVEDTLANIFSIAVRRVSRDTCGNIGYSNTIHLFTKPRPEGFLSPTTQTICPGATAPIIVHFTAGTAPYQIQYTDGISFFMVNNVLDGDTLLVSPLTNTIYQLTNITDSFGCVQTSGFISGAQVLLSPAIFINNVTPTNPGCNGETNGSITISASGGVGALSYSIDNGLSFQSSNIFQNLPAGPYSIIVRDQSGCQQIYVGNPVIITEPTAINQITSFTSASCANVADGSISIQASGGTPPYSYSLNGGPVQPGSTINGVFAGSYTVYVYDSQGCLDTTTVSIPNSYIIAVNALSVTPASCFGANDGQVAVEVVGGIPPYTYSINGITFQSSGIFGGLSAGTYTLIGKDSKGCTEFTQVIIGQPDLITVVIDSLENIQCNGTSTGNIAITTQGGTPTYSYLWSNGQTVEDPINLTAGSYTVTVTDGNGCTGIAGFSLTEPVALFATIAQFQTPLCAGDSSGFVDVTASGGTPPYAFLWSHDGSSQEDAASLPTGIYTVTVTDASHCSAIASQNLIDPAPLQSQIAATAISCPDIANGTADLIISGGTAPYTVLWSNFSTATAQSNLTEGLYTVQIEDANGCQHLDSVFISAPAPWDISAVVANASCGGQATGNINLTVSGGTPAYSFLWSNGQTAEDAINLTVGSYSVTITDQALCSTSASYMITEPAALVVNAVQENVSCNGGNNGTVDITVYGGVLPYAFNWSNGNTTEDLQQLSAGVYTITVTDANNCNRVENITLSEPAAISAVLTAIPVSCFGAADGSATITASGGTAPLSYLWNTFETGQSIQGLSGGTVSVIISDAAGCTRQEAIVINEPTALIASLTSTNPNCHDGANGSIDLSVSGGTPGYSYQWTNGQSTEDLSGLTAGSYSVTITDNQNCQQQSNITLTSPPAIQTNVSVSQPVCSGSQNGFIAILPTGGIAPYSFSWNTNPPQQGAVATQLGAGNYTAGITDAAGCIVSITVSLSDPDPIQISLTQQNAKCFNTADGVVVVNASGGLPPYSYQLDGIVQSSDSFFNLLPNQYVVEVEDANNCRASSSFTITSPSVITVDLTASDQIILQGMTTQLTATATSTGSPLIAYYWGPTDSLFNYSDCANPVFCAQPFVQPVTNTTFTVAAMNADSCYAYASVTILVSNESSSFIPQAFTPNGDGLNDHFEFDILGAKEADIRIFDRWGAEVYANPAQPNGIIGLNGWDGYINGEPAPAETYVWTMTVSYFDGRKEDRSGSLTLIR